MCLLVGNKFTLIVFKHVLSQVEIWRMNVFFLSNRLSSCWTKNGHLMQYTASSLVHQTLAHQTMITRGFKRNYPFSHQKKKPMGDFIDSFVPFGIFCILIFSIIDFKSAYLEVVKPFCKEAKFLLKDMYSPSFDSPKNK